MALSVLALPLAVLRRPTLAHALQRFDVAWSSLDQQVLQGTPIVHCLAHLGHQVFGNVDGKSPSVVTAIQNPARMLLAGLARRAVRLDASRAAIAQRAEQCRPPRSGLVFHPGNDIGRRISLAAHDLYESYYTCVSKKKLSAKNARNA